MNEKLQTELNAHTTRLKLSWNDTMLALPLGARTAWLKLHNIFPLFFSCGRIGKAQLDIMIRDNMLTENEQILFRKHFPNGFFGEPKP